MKDALLRAAAVGALATATLCETPCLVMTVSALASPSKTERPTAVEAGQVFTVVDFPPTPATLSELLTAVDLVVLARVDATSKAQADRGAPSPKVRRYQDLTILEVLKGDSRSPRIKVRQTGGTVSVDGKDYSTDYPVRLMEVGDVVVLFLHRVPTPGHVYDIGFGADGAVWSPEANKPVSLPAGLKKMAEFGGRAPERMSELLAAIRAKKNGADGKDGRD
jgi:hypothetical protein